MNKTNKTNNKNKKEELSPLYKNFRSDPKFARKNRREYILRAA